MILWKGQEYLSERRLAMRICKKIVAFVLTLNICFGNLNVVMAEGIQNDNTKSVLYEDRCTEIYNSCAEDLLICELSEGSNEDKKQILQEKCTQLNEEGIKSYVIDSNNYEFMQEKLKVDLEELGLNPQYTYLITESSSTENSTRSTTSSEFSYTYNGVSYRMKYLTITAADDPAFAKSSNANVLKSASTTLIENCLNTAVSAYISAVYAPLGTVASICGLDISNFGTGQQSTLNLNGAANWTRIYTLVYNENNAMWYRGSCVESVYSFSYMSGTYYDAATNTMKAVPGNSQGSTKYSSYYSDLDWRKRNAVIYMLNLNGCRYDSVGDVSFYYGNEKKITLLENF